MKLGSNVHGSQMMNPLDLWRFSTTQFQHYSAQLNTVPGTTFSITKRYLLNVDGVVIARLCKTAVL